jgi:hypothetical protein
MGAHALGAAAYAVKAVMLANPDRPESAAEEMQWQLSSMTPEIRSALFTLPKLGEDRSGPLGPGLLSTGCLGEIIHELQAGIARMQSDQLDGKPSPLPPPASDP